MKCEFDRDQTSGIGLGIRTLKDLNTPKGITIQDLTPYLTFDSEIQGREAEVRVTGGYARTSFGHYKTSWDFVSEDGAYEEDGCSIDEYGPVIIYLENRGGKWLVSGSSLLDYLDEYRDSLEEMAEYLKERRSYPRGKRAWNRASFPH